MIWYYIPLDNVISKKYQYPLNSSRLNFRIDALFTFDSHLKRARNLAVAANKNKKKKNEFRAKLQN